MKQLLIIISFIACVIMTACSEKESPLLFSVESISNPENVIMEYYSPDPSCVSKMYWIDANSCASEINIKCTNANSIFIEDHEGKILEEYICSGGFWKAEIVNSNTITFTFDEVDSDLYLDQAGFNVVSQTKKGMVKTGIYVKRLPTTSHVGF
ncbi:MAG: hypothetical protein K2N09_00945 [Muribaculaceae bacterium]|nr:hypothetical protein [Muribaculaceae bacterium]